MAHGRGGCARTHLAPFSKPIGHHHSPSRRARCREERFRDRDLAAPAAVYGYREADLQTEAGTQALNAHRWGMRVAKHLAGGFESAWPTDSFRCVDTEWKDSRTHRRWCPRCSKNEPTWARVCEAGGVQSEVSGVVDE